MLKSFQHRALNFFRRLTNDPARASRTVFSSLIIVGILALTLDMGPRIVPQYFGARAVNPLNSIVIAEAQKAFKENNKNFELAVTTCRSYIEQVGYKTFLEDFEGKFAGVLPGVGKLLLEHPATVSSRREELIFETMKKYAQMKFCIPGNQFEIIYLADYKNSLGKLNFYFQAKECKEREKEDPDFTCGQKQEDIFFNTITKEFSLVERDLVSTQRYVTDVIDRAIESAIELDRQTQSRISNLEKQTTNYLLDTIVAQNNENIETNSSAAFLLEAIRDQDADEYPTGGTSTSKTGPKAYKLANSLKPNVPSGKDGVNGTASKPKISFGLLSLLDPAQRENFLASHYSAEMSFYLAGKYSFDPMTPDENALTSTSITPDRTAFDKTMDDLAAGSATDKEKSDAQSGKHTVAPYDLPQGTQTNAAEKGNSESGTPSSGSGGGSNTVLKVEVINTPLWIKEGDNDDGLTSN